MGPRDKVIKVDSQSVWTAPVSRRPRARTHQPQPDGRRRHRVAGRPDRRRGLSPEGRRGARRSARARNGARPRALGRDALLHARAVLPCWPHQRLRAVHRGRWHRPRGRRRRGSESDGERTGVRVSARAGNRGAGRARRRRRDAAESAVFYARARRAAVRDSEGGGERRSGYIAKERLADRTQADVCGVRSARARRARGSGRGRRRLGNDSRR